MRSTQAPCQRVRQGSLLSTFAAQKPRFARPAFLPVHGVKIQDVKRGRKFSRTNVVAARRRDVFGKLLVHISPPCFNHTANSAFFTQWFREGFVKSVPKGATIIMDNATHHPKKKLFSLARRHGVKLLFLSTHSPDLNPLEKDWLI